MRESLFGALESADAISGARVLDLYAGSGALGLESLSRGAVSADLVERSRPAAAIVRRNAATVAKAARSAAAAHVHESAVRTFLQRAAGPYDLVFSDPPYDLDDESMNGDLTALAPLLAPEALVIIERARRSTPPDLAAAGLELLRDRNYGDTTLWWAAPQSAEATLESGAVAEVQPDAESQSR